MRSPIFCIFVTWAVCIFQAQAQNPLPPPPVLKPANSPAASGSNAKVAAGVVPVDVEAELFDSFVYDLTDKRDLFEPILPKAPPPPPKVMPVNIYAKEGDHTLEPLESFDINQLKVVAIVWETKNPKALIVDPTGNSHYVKLKSRIGKKNGFVVAIREGEVVAVEYVEENGQYSKVFRVMELTR